MERKMIAISVVIIIMLSLTYSCATFMEYGKLEKSARQSYQRGSYDSAVSDSAAALRINPDYGKAQSLIKDAFRAAVTSHEGKVKELERSSAKFRWDDIVSEYEALLKLNQTVSRLPTIEDKETGASIRFELTDYTQNLAEARTNAAEVHYQEGLVLSQNGGIDSHKQAAKEFKAACNFCPGYKDANNLYESERQAGIKRVAIIPFEDKTGKEGIYGALSDIIVDQIITELMGDPDSMEFMEIISRDQLEIVLQEQDLGQAGIVDEQTAADLGKVLGVHEIVTGKITQIICSPEATTSRNEKRNSKEVTGKEKYTGSDGKTKERDVYGQVHAEVTIYARTASASIAGSYKIIDAKTAKLKKSDSFKETADFQCTWAAFSGDERALTSNDRNLAMAAKEAAPVEEEMVNQAAEKLVASLAQALKSYVR